MVHAKLESIQKRMAGEPDPDARLTLAFRGIARQVKEYIRNKSEIELAAFADSLDRHTPEMVEAFNREAKGQAHSAAK